MASESRATARQAVNMPEALGCRDFESLRGLSICQDMPNLGVSRADRGLSDIFLLGEAVAMNRLRSFAHDHTAQVADAPLFLRSNRPVVADVECSQGFTRTCMYCIHNIICMMCSSIRCIHVKISVWRIGESCHMRHSKAVSPESRGTGGF